MRWKALSSSSSWKLVKVVLYLLCFRFSAPAVSVVKVMGEVVWVGEPPALLLGLGAMLVDGPGPWACS